MNNIEIGPLGYESRYHCGRWPRLYALHDFKWPGSTHFRVSMKPSSPVHLKSTRNTCLILCLGRHGVPLSIVGPNELIGGAEFFMPAPYLFTAVCASQCELLQVPYAVLSSQRLSSPLMQMIFQVSPFVLEPLLLFPALIS